MSTGQNKAVVRRYLEEFHNTRADHILEEIMAPALLEPTRGMTNALLTAFPDYGITIEAQVAEGDLVATVWTARGTHHGDWAAPIGPVPATGRSVSWTATTTLRIADGKIADVVGTNWDHLGILQQIGAAPAVAPRSGA